MEDKRKLILVILAVILLLVAGGSIYYFASKSTEETVEENESGIETSLKWAIEDTDIYLLTDITLEEELTSDQVVETTFMIYDSENNLLSTYLGSTKYFDLSEKPQINIAYSLMMLDSDFVDSVATIVATTEVVEQAHTSTYTYQFETITEYNFIDDSSAYNDIYRINIDLSDEFQSESGILLMEYSDGEIIKYISYLEDQNFIGATFINSELDIPNIEFTKIYAYRLGSIHEE